MSALLNPVGILFRITFCRLLPAFLLVLLVLYHLQYLLSLTQELSDEKNKESSINHR